MQKNFMIAVQSGNSHLFQRHSNKFNVLKINTQKITLEPRFSQFAGLKWIHSVRFKWFQLISQLSSSVYTVFSPFFMIITLRGKKNDLQLRTLIDLDLKLFLELDVAPVILKVIKPEMRF